MSIQPQTDDREYFQQLVACINKQIITKATHYKILLHENAIKSLLAYRRKHSTLMSYTPEQFTNYLYTKIDRRLTKILEINENTNRNEEQLIKKIIESLFVDDCKSIDQKIDAHEIKMKVKRFDKMCNLEDEEKYLDCWDKTLKILHQPDQCDKKNIIVNALKLSLIDKDIKEALQTVATRNLEPIEDNSSMKRNKGDKRIIDTSDVRRMLDNNRERYGSKLSYSDYDDYFLIHIKTKSNEAIDVKFNQITNTIDLIDDKWNIGENINKKSNNPIDQLRKTIELILTK